ncbi:Dual specificity protein phosphatase 1 [Ancistrocladus abbreviatus]
MTRKESNARLMDFGGDYKGSISALTRGLSAATLVRDDKVPCQIEEGLFLGSLGAANNKRVLKSLNITHILTVARMISPAYPHDFEYKIIDVLDQEDTDLAKHFDECFDFIDEAKRAGGGVLVHCFVGKSRSVTIVVAYLMKQHGMTLNEALEHVRCKRPQASPNPGFVRQLKNFGKSLRGKGLRAHPSQQKVLQPGPKSDDSTRSSSTKLSTTKVLSDSKSKESASSSHQELDARQNQILKKYSQIRKEKKHMKDDAASSVFQHDPFPRDSNGEDDDDYFADSCMATHGWM